MLGEERVERLSDERALAASAYARDADELAKGYLKVDVLEVVAGAAAKG